MLQPDDLSREVGAGPKILGRVDPVELRNLSRRKPARRRTQSAATKSDRGSSEVSDRTQEVKPVRVVYGDSLVASAWKTMVKEATHGAQPLRGKEEISVTTL